MNKVISYFFDEEETEIKAKYIIYIPLIAIWLTTIFM